MDLDDEFEEENFYGDEELEDENDLSMIKDDSLENDMNLGGRN